jgi:hypothetical protein
MYRLAFMIDQPRPMGSPRLTYNARPASLGRLRQLRLLLSTLCPRDNTCNFVVGVSINGGGSLQEHFNPAFDCSAQLRFGNRPRCLHLQLPHPRSGARSRRITSTTMTALALATQLQVRRRKRFSTMKRKFNAESRTRILLRRPRRSKRLRQSAPPPGPLSRRGLGAADAVSRNHPWASSTGRWRV